LAENLPKFTLPRSELLWTPTCCADAALQRLNAGDIPLQSNVSAEEVASLPSSPTAANADAVLDLLFVTPSCSLALQSKHV